MKTLEKQMGQYWKVVFLGPDGIQFAMSPSYGALKLMEHAYLDSPFVHTVERLISPGGLFQKMPVVWVGDYAESGLQKAADEIDDVTITFRTEFDSQQYKYIVNHDTKEYVDKFAHYDSKKWNLHALPLLVADGNGLGNGDYRGLGEVDVGRWCRNVVTMEKKVPPGYTLLDIHFE